MFMEHTTFLSISSDKKHQTNCAVTKTYPKTSQFKVQSYTNISNTVQ